MEAGKKFFIKMTQFRFKMAGPLRWEGVGGKGPGH